MGKIFTITDDIKAIASNAIDDIIDQLGKDCQLIYPSIQADCPNCVFDPTTNRSSGIFKTGGPRPFQRGTICPVCRGNGKLDNQATETIRMLCQWNPKQFMLAAGNIQIPNSIVETKGYLTDLPKILASRKMILQVPIEPYMRYTFELWGEPIDRGNIIQNRYFYALWKRVGG
jgi:hypothetical protein